MSTFLETALGIIQSMLSGSLALSEVRPKWNTIILSKTTPALRWVLLIAALSTTPGWIATALAPYGRDLGFLCVVWIYAGLCAMVLGVLVTVVLRRTILTVTIEGEESESLALSVDIRTFGKTWHHRTWHSVTDLECRSLLCEASDVIVWRHLLRATFADGYIRYVLSPWLDFLFAFKKREVEEAVGVWRRIKQDMAKGRSEFR